MKRSVALIAVVALVLVGGLAILLATRQPLTATPLQSPLLGKAAPAFRGHELSGGTFSLAAERGNVVVLNFWASWCTPCKEEAPNLSTLAWQEQHAHRHVVVVGVVFNDSLASARAFERYYGSLYPSISDPQGTIAFNYGVTSPPTTFVISARGTVAATLIGPASQRQLEQVVARVAQ